LVSGWLPLFISLVAPGGIRVRLRPIVQGAAGLGQMPGWLLIRCDALSEVRRTLLA
jgi:hypothetical protein